MENPTIQQIKDAKRKAEEDIVKILKDLMKYSEAYSMTLVIESSKNFYEAKRTHSIKIKLKY